MPEILELNQLPETLVACCQSLLDKKAADLIVMDVRGHSTITDYYVVASGLSAPQLKAMAMAAKSTLKGHAALPGGLDGDPASGWIVLDAYEFVVHLFLSETRETYALESLWKDRPRLQMEG